MTDNLFALYGADFRSLAPQRPKPQQPFERTGDGVAIIPLVGVLSRDGRYGGSSTDHVRTLLRQAAADPGIRQVVLFVRSPGGLAAGSAELSDTVAATAARKPTVAFVSDLAASAAYYGICGCTKIVAAHSALCGSIGTYAVLIDTSGLAASMGIKVHVVRAGEHKGAAEPGSRISEKQLLEFQRVVDALNSQFLAAVGAGRKLSQQRLEAVTDGRIHIASEARSLGLIDSIGTLDDVLASAPMTVPGGAASQRSRLMQRAGLQAAPVARTNAIVQKMMR